MLIYHSYRYVPATEIGQNTLHLFFAGGIAYIFFYHSMRITAFYPARIAIFLKLPVSRYYETPRMRNTMLYQKFRHWSAHAIINSVSRIDNQRTFILQRFQAGYCHPVTSHIEYHIRLCSASHKFLFRIKLHFASQ